MSKWGEPTKPHHGNISPLSDAFPELLQDGYTARPQQQPYESAKATNLTARTPSNLVQSPNGDVAAVPANGSYIVAMCLMFFLTVVQIVVFQSLGVFEMHKAAIFGPILSMAGCPVIAFRIKKTTIRFSPNAGAGGGPNDGVQQRTAEYSVHRLWNWCCPIKCIIDVDSIRSVESRRTNRQYLHEVVAILDGSAVVLYRGYMDDAAQELVNWRAYLRGHS
uniref:Uncharacterized protein n=1 Tax=Neobodo designis TaxID=312471 RepID=A0A7S1R606_NEODS|eukprot:CAMPEP_0174852092 /NCGR_PEP_ID=MMETSP1114-20130205/25185_1 /TAXON_ID=312471 /ORGANISM="Neobodo designis, Strain CCAP 1951/1" /LENGTH=219 /DNA_ID=CAMNT_0016086669 /DNA_START=26 /DNA_END=685 /DNA_ORIENTATION=-